MRLLTQKNGELSSFSDKKDEREGGIVIASIKHMLIDSHTNGDNKEKIKAHVRIDHFFRFFTTFENISKSLGFEIQIKTPYEKQNIFQTNLGGNDVIVIINSLSLYVPNLVPSPSYQQMFNEAIRKSFTKSFDTWVTDRKPLNKGIEYQLDLE